MQNLVKNGQFLVYNQKYGIAHEKSSKNICELKQKLQYYSEFVTKKLCVRS